MAPAIPFIPQAMVPHMIIPQAPLAIGMVEELTHVASQGDLDSGLAAELSKLQAIFGSSDALEGLSALLERRRPTYKGM